MVDVAQPLLAPGGTDQVVAYSQLFLHMPFYGVLCQLGVMAIKLECLFPKRWLGAEFCPGKGEGQEYIDDNVIRPPAAEEGGVCCPACPTKVKVVCPVAVGGDR